MKNKGFFICFTGMDGTGKTTLSKTIVHDLDKKKGIKCKYVYARFNPILSKPFIALGRLLFIRKGDLFQNYSEYISIKRNAIYKHSFLTGSYQKILLFDYLLQIVLKIKLPLALGENIICDRYIYDTIISDLSVDMNYSKEGSIKLLDKLYKFFPKPDKVFLMDVAEEIAFSRKDDLPSIKYLQERRNRYLQLGVHYNMIILDGSKSQEQLANFIENKILMS